MFVTVNRLPRPEIGSGTRVRVSLPGPGRSTKRHGTGDWGWPRLIATRQNAYLGTTAWLGPGEAPKLRDTRGLKKGLLGSWANRCDEKFFAFRSAFPATQKSKFCSGKGSVFLLAFALSEQKYCSERDEREKLLRVSLHKGKSITQNREELS